MPDGSVVLPSVVGPTFGGGPAVDEWLQDLRDRTEYLAANGSGITGSTGGNGAADSGKAALFNSAGELTSRGIIVSATLPVGVAGSWNGARLLQGSLTISTDLGASVQINAGGFLFSAGNIELYHPAASGTMATHEWVASRLATVTTDATTARTLAVEDHDTIIVFTNASAITVTVPASLGEGFHCTLVQQGSGQVTIAAGAGATLQSFGGLLKTAGPHARVGIAATAASTYNVSGTLVA